MSPAACPISNTWKTVMDSEEPVYFDLETVSLMRATLDDAWACLPSDRKAMTSRTILAEGILKSAAKGERDPERLLDAALMAVATYESET
jgi:hypothetical protein